MNKISKLIIGTLVCLVLLALWGLSSTRKASLGGTADGLIASIGTATTANVGPQETVTLFATSTCVGRTVGTAAGAVVLTFIDSQTPTGSLGFTQAASTTVFYDASQYGCGKMKAYGYASTTITVNQVI